MKLLFVYLMACGVGLSVAATPTADTDAEKAARDEKVKATLAEHARRNATRGSSRAEVTEEAATPAVAEAKTPEDSAQENVTTLPSMEVRNSRITELDLQIRKLDKQLERERKKTKSSDLDVSLNDAKAARKFSLFGGKSTEQRESVAAERVQLMEAEREILEAMKLPKSREELALLQKQVNDLQKVRRDLDLALH